MTKRKLHYSGLGLAVLMVGAVAACSSDNSNPGGGGGSGPTGGTHSGGTGPSTGGTPGTGGSNVGGTSTGGSATGGTGTGGSAGFACTNTMPTCAVITDGANLVPNATKPGDFTLSGAVEGGTYSYQPNALTLDSVGKTALNVKGNVKDYDGVGIYFNTCYDVKTLGYTGVSFSIKGNAGPTGMVGFRVQTNSNTAIDATNKKGTCVASNPTGDTYPDCHAAEKQVPVTSTPTVVTVNFADLTGGVPTAGVSGADVVGIEWALAWDPKWAAGAGGSGAGGSAAGGAAAGGSAAGGAASGGSGGKAGSGAGGSATGGTGAGGTGAAALGPYDADITIDDVKFIGGPATPAVCPAGTGGSGAGGASSGGSSAGGGSSGGSSSGGSSSGGTSAGGSTANAGKAGG